MKPPPFDYHVPGTLEEAVGLKREHGAQARALAGGQSLIPLMASRRTAPRVLIDVKRIPELQAVRRENGSLVVGAAVRQSRLHDDPAIGEALGVLAEAARHIGHLETRHRGTVGGSLAHADPVAELPVVAVATGAQVVVRAAGGERTVPAGEFFVGPRRTALAEDELVTAIRYPVAAAGWGFAEIARRHGDPAMATAVAFVELDDQGAVVSASVTLGAVAGRPRRAGTVEDALRGGAPSPDRITAAAMAAGEVVEDLAEGDEVGPTPHPPAVPRHYRERLARTAAARALTQAAVRAGGGGAT